MSDNDVAVRLQIMQLLLNRGEDMSLAEIGKCLGLSSSHVYYHLKKMVEMGVLNREEVGRRAFYTPQPLFTEDIRETLDLLNKVSKGIIDVDGEKIANCVYMFLMCYDVD